MKRVIDPQDEKILVELTMNARISHAELGEKIHLSRNAVRQRIERMERDGVIQGYTLKLGEGKRTTSLISAVIFVYRFDRMRGNDVVTAIKKFPEVVNCEIMSGEYDLMLRIEAENPERVHLIWKEIAALASVENTVTTFSLSKL